MDQKITNNSVKPQDGEQRAVGPIVHMRADSDSLLENMFNVALKTPGTEMPLQKPMRMRNLPASFFKPPNMGSKSPSCHSRENSLDSTSLQDPYSPAMNLGSPQPQQQPIHINPGHQGPQGGQAPPPPHSGSGTAIHHSRAHSSPAQLLGGAQLVTVQVPLQQQVTTQQAQQQAQQQQQQNLRLRQQQIDAKPNLVLFSESARCHFCTVLCPDRATLKAHLEDTHQPPRHALCENCENFFHICAITRHRAKCMERYQQHAENTNKPSNT